MLWREKGPRIKDLSRYSRVFGVVYCGVLWCRKKHPLFKFLECARGTFFEIFFFHTKNTLNRGQWCTVGKMSGVLVVYCWVCCGWNGLWLRFGREKGLVGGADGGEVCWKVC